MQAPYKIEHRTNSGTYSRTVATRKEMLDAIAVIGPAVVSFQVVQGDWADVVPAEPDDVEPAEPDYAPNHWFIRY